MLLCRSLGRGGTERQITALAKGMAGRGHEVAIVTFYAVPDAMTEGLTEAGVRLIDLGKSGRWDLIGFALRFLAEARRQQPDIIYSFLAVPNVIALLARLSVPHIPVVWGVRTAGADVREFEWLARLSFRFEAALAGQATLTIANSQAGAEFAKRRGFPAGRTKVIPNGVDTERFKPDAAARDHLRRDLGVAEDAILIGMLGRMDPQKDFAGFLDAGAKVIRADARVRLAVVGDGPIPRLEALRAQATKLGIADRIVWSPARPDVEAVYNALDLLALVSPAEGMPNVVLEAMACGVPAVASDVGDCRLAIDKTGRVAPVGDTESLAAAMLELVMRIRAEHTELARNCRQRILDRYSLPAMVSETERLLAGV